MGLSTIKWLELLTIIFGLFCVGISIILSYKFHRVKQTLSKALSFQLFAEGVVGFVTVLFAVTSWLNLYAHLHPLLVVVMRVAIFTAASSTSINLYKRVKDLENSNEPKEGD